MYNDKKIALIIPTRYNSERLNGKVLCDIAGKKQIEWIIERASQSKYIDRIILAVSDKEYIPILKWFHCENKNKNVFYFSGSHHNIIQRCLDAANFHNIDIIVDVSHDCTFFDPYLADLLIERLFEYNADYSANCITRSFPDGFDIQVYTIQIYQEIYNTNKYINYYSGWNIWHCREEIFPKPKIINLEAEKEYYYPHWHLCLDTEEDKTVIEKIIIEGFKNDSFRFPYKHNQLNYWRIINFLEKHPEILEINKSVIPTKLLEEN